jgi:DNA repair exonuclease SbcCD ATPase subunit
MLDTLREKEEQLHEINSQLAQVARNKNEYKGIESRLQTEKDRLTEQKKQITDRENAYRLKLKNYGSFNCYSY